jgi:hypothetical protein
MQQPSAPAASQKVACPKIVEQSIKKKWSRRHHAAIARQRKGNVEVGRKAHFPKMSCRKIDRYRCVLAN